MSEFNTTGFDCLRTIVAGLKTDLDFDSLLTDEVKNQYLADPAGALASLANAYDLQAREVADPGQIGKYRGPALLQLDNGNWICLVNTATLSQDNGASLIFDPLIGDDQKIIQIDNLRLIPKIANRILIFDSLHQLGQAENSGLFCVTALAGHFKHTLEMRQLRQEYDLTADTEPAPELLLTMLRNNGKLKARKIHVDPAKIVKHKLFPLLARKNDGKYAIVCGLRQTENDEPNIAVLDPAGAKQQFHFITAGEFARDFTGDCIAAKKIIRITDENQPFGLLWFIPEFLKLKGIFGQIALTVFMITLIALVVPLFFQIVVDKVLFNRSYNTLNVLGIGIVCAIVFNGFLEYLRNYFLLFATNKIDISTATRTFSHLMRLPIGFFEKVPSGILLKHMQQTERIRGFLSGNLFFTLLDLLSLVVFIPFLLMYSVNLTLVVFGYSLLIAAIIAVLIRPFQHRLNDLYRAEGKRQSMLLESLQGVRTIKSLALEPVQEKRWDETTAGAISAFFRVGKISMTARTLSQMLEMLMSISIIWLGSIYVFDNVMTIGALIAFQMLSNRVSGPLVKAVGLVHEYQQVAVSVQMLGQVMNTPDEANDAGLIRPLNGNIVFDQVTFRYDQDGPEVIKNLSVEFPVNSVIGIVGRSGSGKTTLTKLLQGLYQIQQGSIKINGTDIAGLNKSHLRSNIGVVLQENYFFSGTVRENICLSKPTAAMEEVIRAAKTAGADEFIQNLVKGYDTMLEENAVNLSGGQKQRLAIARALLADPPVLIFDEATSALDPDSENVILTNLPLICRNRTVLIISHRLSIVSGSDKILVLDNGVRTDFAGHRELLSRPGIYHDFWYQQMERNLAK